MTSKPEGRYRRIHAPSNLGADSLAGYAKKTAAEVEARRRLLEKDEALRNKACARLLQTLTPEAKAAFAERAALEKQAFEAKSKAARLALPKKIVPEVISSHPGGQSAYPPFDGTWTDPTNSGGIYAGANSAQGWISISLAAGGSLYGGAGVQLWIVPASSSDTLYIMPAMVFSGSYSANSYFLGGASLEGIAEVLVYPYDDQGYQLPEFNQQQQTQVFSASAAGVEQSAGGDISGSWYPVIELQHGTTYALWMIIRNAAASAGPGQAISDFAVTLPYVFIEEYQ